MDIEIEHADFEDLEERFQISTEVFFDSKKIEYEGMNPFVIEVKKKKNEKTKIENIELGKSKSRNSLF